MIGVTLLRNLWKQRIAYRFDEVQPLVSKQAVLGLNQPKMMILKGFNLFLNRDLKPFNTKEEALDYLVSE